MAMDRKPSNFNPAVRRKTALDVMFQGRHSYGGGGTSTAATVTGVKSTDTVVATVTASTNSSYVVKAVPTTNTVTFTLSADPGASTEISYVVVRATS